MLSYSKEMSSLLSNDCVQVKAAEAPLHDIKPGDFVVVRDLRRKSRKEKKVAGAIPGASDVSRNARILFKHQVILSAQEQGHNWTGHDLKQPVYKLEPIVRLQAAVTVKRSEMRKKSGSADNGLQHHSCVLNRI